VVGCCECGDEHSGCLMAGNFLTGSASDSFYKDRFRGARLIMTFVDTMLQSQNSFRIREMNFDYG
jgi:hypothetical protein